ncbi:MAG TPA: DoxX family protein [Terracidiphilus sp.]|jgi:hypothetical protein
MLAAVFIVMAMVVAIFAAKQEEAGAPQSRRAWVLTIAYWVFTIPVAFEMAAGGVWDLLRIEYVQVILTHLGYPLYLLYIIGVPKVPCAFVLLSPRFPRLKEWAYAGAFFNYAGAAASHLLVRDAAGAWLGPLIFSVFTIVSWSLRPAGRRLEGSMAARDMRAVAWVVPILIAVAMLGVAFVTLPKGAPPQ